MAVCPAGRNRLGEFLDDERAYRERVVEPFKQRQEAIYVVPGSDAEAHVTQQPAKTPKPTSNGIRPHSAANFLESLPLVFQRGRSEALEATYHFSFTGEGACEGTAVIKDRTIRVMPGLLGEANLRVTADGPTWVAFLAKEKSLPVALATRKLRIKGSPRLLTAFARCFPS
jgi:hypothetical protein